MEEFGFWDRVRHTYTNGFSQEVVREGNITAITDVGITYVTSQGNNFFARTENLTLISKRTRKRVKPTKREKELRAKLRELERYIVPIAASTPDPYEDMEYMRGFEKGMATLAKDLLEIITEGKR